MFQTLLRVNFIVATWLITAYLVYWAISNFSIPYEQFRNQYGLFRSIRGYLGPAIFLSVHLFLWFFALRKNDPLSKVAAFFEAIVVLAFAVLIPLLRADTYEKELPTLFVYGGLYTSLSFMLYAIVYRFESTTTTVSFR